MLCERSYTENAFIGYHSTGNIQNKPVFELRKQMSGCRGSGSQGVAAGACKTCVLSNANVLELDSANVAL